MAEQVGFQWLITGGSRDRLGCELAEAGSAWLWDKEPQGTWGNGQQVPCTVPSHGTAGIVAQFLNSWRHCSLLSPPCGAPCVLGLVDAASSEQDSRELGSICQINQEFRG